MKSHDKTVVQVAFIIPPKVNLLDVTGPVQIFYEAACNGAPVKLLYGTVFSEHTESTGSCTLTFNRLTPFNDMTLNSGDYLFIPGLDYSLISSPRFLMELRPFLHWLTLQHQRGIILCGIFTGAFLLGSAGLLNGRACTTHWEYTDKLKAMYPEIMIQANRLFVYDDRIYTGAGTASSIDIALYLVELLFEAHFAAKIAKEAVIFCRRNINDPQSSVFTQYRDHCDQRIHKVQDILIQSLGQKLTIHQIAAQVKMSGRNLTRLFKKITEITINRYLDELRVAHAKRLIGEGHTLQATALHCGLKGTYQLHQLLDRYQIIKNSA